MLYISSDELPRVNPNKTQFHSHTCALLMAKCCGYSLNLVPATIHVIFVFFALSLNLVPRPSAGGGEGRPCAKFSRHSGNSVALAYTFRV